MVRDVLEELDTVFQEYVDQVASDETRAHQARCARLTAPLYVNTGTPECEADLDRLFAQEEAA